MAGDKHIIRWPRSYATDPGCSSSGVSRCSGGDDGHGEFRGLVRTTEYLGKLRNGDSDGPDFAAGLQQRIEFTGRKGSAATFAIAIDFIHSGNDAAGLSPVVVSPGVNHPQQLS
jgi:hypothetical protein